MHGQMDGRTNDWTISHYAQEGVTIHMEFTCVPE